MNLTSRTLLSPVSVAVVLPAAFALLTGCKKDDPPPPPLPTATAAATQEPLKLEAMDAGIEAIDSGEPKKTGGGRPSGGLGPCCAALTQNANLAPEPTKSYMLQAAATCQAAASAGQSASAAMGAISGMLRGAGMPAACK